MEARVLVPAGAAETEADEPPAGGAAPLFPDCAWAPVAMAIRDVARNALSTLFVVRASIVTLLVAPQGGCLVRL